VNPAGNNGLLYGNPEQLLHQVMGIGVTLVLAVVGTFIILKFISIFTPLRVSKEDELMGLDLSFHEEPAYHNGSQHPVGSQTSKPVQNPGIISDQPIGG
jgi:Amt family ammonium transporter